MVTDTGQLNETLDPENPEDLRALGHRMLDDMFDHVAALRERPAWRPLPHETRAAFQRPLPSGEQAAEDVYGRFVEDILPYGLGNDHPRFWGWVMGNGTPLGMLADMLASGMNSNVGAGEQAPRHVEMQVIEWCKEMLGFPAEASGLLVSGGSMANLVGLTVARNARAGFDVRSQGLAAATRPFALYASVETHSSVRRAIELLGLGNSALRSIRVNEDYTIDLTALQAAIAQDVAAGIESLCLIGSAGTVNTGATDPLSDMADIAQRYGMWFHVDGAFGALARLAPAYRSVVAGMERADSLAFDLHKWGYQPYEAGCVLVRDPRRHYETFAYTPDYLKHGDRGTAGADLWFSDYGIQLSRGFRALKIWMALSVHGTEKLGRLIQQNIEQARYLADLVTATPELQLMAPVPLNIVCFRFAADLPEEGLNALNEELLIRIQESGVAVPTGTRLQGKYAIRCAITNHRSRREDFDALVAAAVRLGRDIRR
jgi:aromatic-L-amino-acid/L-tryptophan decarboxylase